MKNEKNRCFTKKVSLHPFIYMSISMHSSAIAFALLLLLQIVMLFLTGSFSSLLVIGMTFAGALSAALLYFFRRNRNPDSIFLSLLQGILVGFFLPKGFPPASAFFITFFILLIYKYFFNESVSGWVNPIALTVCTAWIIGKKYFPGFEITANEVAVRNSSLVLIQNGSFQILNFDTVITDFLNKTVFGLFNINIPEGYVSLLLDTHSVIPAFRFNFLTIVSSLFIFSWDMVSPVITFVFLFVYAILVRFFSPVFFGGLFFSGDVILALCTSGTLFCALYVLPFAGTIPISKPGKFLYGIIAGIAAFLIVGCGTSPIGCMFTVLVANIFSPIIQIVENRYAERKLGKMLMEKDEVIYG